MIQIGRYLMDKLPETKEWFGRVTVLRISDGKQVFQLKFGTGEKGTIRHQEDAISEALQWIAKNQ